MARACRIEDFSAIPLYFAAQKIEGNNFPAKVGSLLIFLLLTLGLRTRKFTSLKRRVMTCGGG